MKAIGWILGVLMTVVVVFLGLQVLASETGEVVVLITDDGANGAATRLWVVDHEGQPWLRAGGGGDSGWYQRLQAEPRVILERDGVSRRYVASPAPAVTPRINQRIREKYGWRDQIISVLAGSRENGIAIRLTPADDPPRPAPE